MKPDTLCHSCVLIICLSKGLAFNYSSFVLVIQAFTPQVLRAEKKPLPEQTPKSGSEEEEEFEADEDVEAISSEATQVEESEAVATEVSEESLEVVSEEEVEVGSEDETEVEGGYVAVFE